MRQGFGAAVAICGVMLLSTSCDPAILFFEEPSNVSIDFREPNVGRVRYWTESGDTQNGDVASRVAAALFPDDERSEPRREDDEVIVEVAGVWSSQQMSTIHIDGKAAYAAVLSSGGHTEQGIGFCVPAGTELRLSADEPAFDVHGGCGAWSVHSLDQAPRISLSLSPRVGTGILSLVLALVGTVIGIHMIRRVLLRRPPSRKASLILCTVLAAMSAVVLLNTGDHLMFSLIGLRPLNYLSTAAVLGLMLSVIVGVVVAAKSLIGGHSVPPRPDD